MSFRVVGYTPEGRRITVDEGPNTATLRNRGGLALGQALTASQVKPVGAGTPEIAPLRTVHGLRGESVLARRRK